MRISVKVRPGSRQEKIARAADNMLVVWVRARAAEGKANQALIRVLSDYFKVPPSRISILRGGKSRDKILEIII